MKENNTETEVLEGEDMLDRFFAGKDTDIETEKEEPSEKDKELEEIFSEKEKEEEKVETEQDPPEEVETQETATFNVYKELISEKIKDGDWTDGEIELEDGTTVLLSDLDEVDEEIYAQVKKAQKDLKDEDFKSKYISTDGLDETAKKLVDIKRTGGDIDELLRMEKEIVNPIKQANLDDEKVQEGLVYNMYKAKGLGDTEIGVLINKHKSELTLDSEAKKWADQVNNYYDGLVEKKRVEHEQQLETAKQERKTLTKSLTEEYKKLQLDDKVVKTLTESVSKVDQNGISKVDELFFEAKKSPELYSKLVFLLTNEELFSKTMGLKVKNQVEKSTVKRLLSLTPKASSTSAAKKPKEEDKVAEFFNQK